MTAQVVVDAQGAKFSEDDGIEERISAKPVPAVDAHAGALTGGVEALQPCLAPGVRVDASHGIVLARHDGDGFTDGVDAGKVDGYAPYAGEPLQDLLLPEMAEVEMDVLAQLVLKGVAGFDLALDAPRDDIPGRKLHGLRHVALHEPLALVVDEVGALAHGTPRT